ncbi:uncharacterized protein LOC114956231 isoform X2 [Acropora millepora]|nr:uncharacterized protein LOC114956231 isoform X2 [Acropora millepora]
MGTLFEGVLLDEPTIPLSFEDNFDSQTSVALQGDLTPPGSIKDYEEQLTLPKPPDAFPGDKPKMKELTIPLDRLRVATNCVTKKLELEEDEYIFCSKCDKLQIGVCSIHCHLRWVKQPLDVPVTEGQTKARATIPVNMDLKPSSIPDAGLGIFAKDRFESDVVFGPYWGQKISVSDLTPNVDQSYMWDIIENGLVTHVIDARDEKYSNWLRFVNCARNEDEQNLIAFQYRGHIYYRSFKVIEPGMELLVWYGDRYACDLDILQKENKPSDGPIQCQKCFMMCSGPISLASHNKFRCQMNSEHDRWRCIHCDRSFKSQHSLHFHKNIHKGLRPFTCRICGKAFTHPASRNRHYHSFHVDKESIVCKIYGKAFSDDNSLKSHSCTKTCIQNRQHGDQSFVSAFALSKHMRVHEKQRDTPYQCKQCLKFFSSSKSLNRHIKLHETSHTASSQKKAPAGQKCQHCGNVFSSAVALSNHMRMHEKQFRINACPICKVSNYSGSLARHMRKKHPGAKVIRCGKCGKVCADKRVLAVHIAIRHPVKRNSLKQGHGQGKAKKRISNLVSVKRKCDQMATSRKKSVNSNVMPRQTNGNISCEICFAVFPSSKLMHCHRASHFRKSLMSSPAESVVPSRRSEDLAESNSKLRCNISHKGSSSSDTSCSHSSISLSERPTVASDINQHQPNCNLNAQSPYPGGSPTGSFCCTICKKSFSTVTSLRSHKASHTRSHTTSKALNIGLFPKKTPKIHERQQTYLSAESMNIPTATFRCLDCNKTFPTERSLRSHKSHHGRLFTSGRLPLNPMLKSSQPSEEDSRNPSVEECDSNKAESVNTPAATFRCLDCNKTFPTGRSLRSHKSHHGRLFTSGRFPLNPLLKSSQPSEEDSRDTSLEECDSSKPMRQNSGSKSEGKRESPSEQAQTKTFSTLLDKNFKSTSKRELFSCGECGKAFISKRNLARHKGHHSRSNHLKLFSTKFSQTSSNFKLAANTDNQKTYECSTCLESFYSGSALVNHQRRIHKDANSNFICPFCDKIFLTRASLLLHKQDLHSSSDPFTCKHCNGRFSSKYSRNNHLCLSEGSPCLANEVSFSNNQCSRSGQSAPLMHSINNHGRLTNSCLSTQRKRQHSGSSSIHHQGEPKENITLVRKVRKVDLSKVRKESVATKGGVIGSSDEPYLCDVCFEPFKTKIGLNNHKRSHIGRSEPFICSICHRGFVSKRNLRRHRKLHSSSPEVKVFPFACFTCSKPFQSYSGLYKHRKRCPGKANPYSSRKMRTKDGLDDHERINLERKTGEGKWQCQYCEKEFQRRCNLRRHVSKKHAKQPKLQTQGFPSPGMKSTETHWKCQHCERQFRTEFGLLRHVEKRHDKRAWVGRQESYKTLRDNKNPWNCLYCGNEFNSIHGIRKHVSRKHPGRKKIYGRRSCSPEERKESRDVSEHSEKRTVKRMVMAIRCQYCNRGFPTVSKRYKHVMLVHKEELVSLPLPDHNCLKNESENIPITIHPKDLESQDCKEIDEDETTGDEEHLGATKSKSLPHLMKPGGNTGALDYSFYCRYCKKGFLNKCSCRRHELRLHEKKLKSTSTVSQDSKEAAGNKAKTTGQHFSEVKCKSLTGLSKVITKRRALDFNSYCRYCKKRFLNKSSCRRHELRLHEKRLKSSSAAAQNSKEAVEKARTNTRQHLVGMHELRLHETQRKASSTVAQNRKEATENEISNADQHVGEGKSKPPTRLSKARSELSTLDLSFHCRRHELRVHKKEIKSSSAVAQSSKVAAENDTSCAGQHLGEAKSKPSRPKKATIKRSALDYNFCCRYCRKWFFARSSRRKHELKFHANQLESSSASLMVQNCKTEEQKPFDKRAISSEGKLSVKLLAKTCSDGPKTRVVFDSDIPKRNKAFPCQHCSRQFITVSRRYKHNLLVHSKQWNLGSSTSQVNVTAVTDRSDAKFTTHGCRVLRKKSSLHQIEPLGGSDNVMNISTVVYSSEVSASVSSTHLNTITGQDRTDPKPVSSVLPCYEDARGISASFDERTFSASKSLDQISQKTLILLKGESLDGFVNEVGLPTLFHSGESSSSPGISARYTETDEENLNAKLTETMVCCEENGDLSLSSVKITFPTSNLLGKPLQKGSKVQPIGHLSHEFDYYSSLHEPMSFEGRKMLTQSNSMELCGSFSAGSRLYEHSPLVHSKSDGLADQDLIAWENGSVNKPSQGIPHQHIENHIFEKQCIREPFFPNYLLHRNGIHL